MSMVVFDKIKSMSGVNINAEREKGGGRVVVDYIIIEPNYYHFFDHNFFIFFLI